jgi:hypothetical protein
MGQRLKRVKLHTPLSAPETKMSPYRTTFQL